MSCDYVQGDIGTGILSCVISSRGLFVCGGLMYGGILNASR